MIVLHRPKYVDTASALALLQEEELHRSRSTGFNKDSARTNFRSLPDKPRSSDGETSRQKVQKSKTDDKLATLKELRRRNGLCFKYGEKWSHDLKCLAQVSLHVIEELLDALEDTESEAKADDSSETEETVIAMGHLVADTAVKRTTMRLCGQIGNIQALILVDSGSVGSFISQQLASQLTHLATPCEPSHFVAADGSPMICNISEN